jgi:threonine/homoserine/homoserine lactone efflux protein
MTIDIALVISTLFILFLAVISPGPDFIMVLRNSLTFGRKAGIFSALGVATGCLISFTLVMCGLKVLFAYKIVKGALSLVCGAYLIYMGIMSIRSKSQHSHIDCQHQNHAPMSTYYRNGLFTNILNPKLYTLAVAILTFPEQQHPSFATNTAIVIGQSLMALVWFIAVSLIFSHGKVQDVYFKRERLINILLGFVFVIIGSKIMFG